MKIRLYDKPIPVTVELIDKTVILADALGTIEYHLGNMGVDSNKIIINFLIRLDDGSGLVVNQDQILSKDAEEGLHEKTIMSRLRQFFGFF